MNNPSPASILSIQRKVSLHVANQVQVVERKNGIKLFYPACQSFRDHGAKGKRRDLSEGAAFLFGDSDHLGLEIPLQGAVHVGGKPNCRGSCPATPLQDWLLELNRARARSSGRLDPS